MLNELRVKWQVTVLAENEEHKIMREYKMKLNICRYKQTHYCG